MKFKNRVKVTETKNGFTIWVDGKWIIDASMFYTDKIITISTYNLKPKRKVIPHHKNYVFEEL